MTEREFCEILANISFPGFRFNLLYRSVYPYLQISFDGPCNVTGEQSTWTGRKWQLSVHMTESEVVQTALKAVLTALEHEAREKFTYLGQPIFGPHLDVRKLVDLMASSEATSIRPQQDN